MSDPPLTVKEASNLLRLPAVEWLAKHGTDSFDSADGRTYSEGDISKPDWSRDGISISLPHPPKSLRPNARVHWADKARATKAYRALAAMEARVVCGGSPPRWAKATVLIQWCTTRAATIDPDAVVSSMKAALDGLQDAGVVANDRALFPERPEILLRQPWNQVVLTVRQELTTEAAPQ